MRTLERSGLDVDEFGSPRTPDFRFATEQELDAIEPSAESEEAWANEVAGIANFTLFPRTDSWWTGANIPGKPRYFSAYLGGALYYQRIADVAAKDYDGFVFERAHGAEGAVAT